MDTAIQTRNAGRSLGRLFILAALLSAGVVVAGIWFALQGDIRFLVLAALGLAIFFMLLGIYGLLRELWCRHAELQKLVDTVVLNTAAKEAEKVPANVIQMVEEITPSGKILVLKEPMGPQFFEHDTAIFLRITTPMDRHDLAKIVEDRDVFKVMAKTLIHMRIWGIDLIEDRFLPSPFQRAENLKYFRLDVSQSTRMWDRITDEKQFAIRWKTREPLELEIAVCICPNYSTVPKARVAGIPSVDLTTEEFQLKYNGQVIRPESPPAPPPDDPAS